MRRWAEIEPVLRGWDPHPAVEILGARLIAPLTFPGKVLCAGANYWDHIAEMGVERPEQLGEPFFFLKPPTTTVTGPGDAIPLPAYPGARVDWALARHLGAHVIATSRSADKRATLAASGIDVVLDATADDFAEQVRATGGRGVDIAIDNLGDPHVWETTMQSLARGGAVVCSGAFLGGKVELDLLRLYSSSHRLIGVRTGNPASIEALWTHVEKGFRAVLDRTFPIAGAADAHRYLEDASNIGRVALTLSREDWRSGD